MPSVSGKRSSDAWHGCTDVTAISPTMTSSCGAGYCKRGTTPAASCHRGRERTRDYFRQPPKRRFPLFSYIYENLSRGPHRNQRSVSYGESMEKAIDFCFRTGGTAGSVVTTQIATGVAFMAPSAIRCDRLAERDLSNFPEVLPYSHRWHTVLSTSISSE